MCTTIVEGVNPDKEANKVKYLGDDRQNNVCFHHFGVCGCVRLKLLFGLVDYVTTYLFERHIVRKFNTSDQVVSVGKVRNEPNARNSAKCV